MSRRQRVSTGRLAATLAARIIESHPRLAADLCSLVQQLSPTSHSRDFCSVRWFGRSFTFSPTQAAIVRQLWRAWEQGTPDLRQDTLLEASGSTGDKISDLFRGHPAWETMISSALRGTFRLQEPPPS